MGKKKRVSEKLRLYYRGYITKPTWIADEEGMKTIGDAIAECLPKRSRSLFRTPVNSDSGVETLKFVVGLKSCLRCLKHNRTKALIYDDTASRHLSKYLNDFGAKQSIPVVQAHRLIDLAPKIKLQTLLVISLIDPTIDETIYKEHDPRPKQPTQTVKSEAFDKLYDYIFVRPRSETQEPSKDGFKMPDLSRVISTGKSQAKKEAKKLAKEKDAPNKRQKLGD